MSAIRTAYLALLICSATAYIAFAQPNEAPPGTIDDSKPADPPNPAADPNKEKSLTEKLKDSEGVLKPPPAVDPEIRKSPPEDPGSKMPVIIPPGEPGGDQSIQPK
ncbi:MAG: hypothetical protein ABL897_08940 [Hyphomicrobium sp.]